MLKLFPVISKEQMDSDAAAGRLYKGELYYIQDIKRLAFGDSSTKYTMFFDWGDVITHIMHGPQLGGDLHATATSDTPGFMSEADYNLLRELYNHFESHSNDTSVHYTQDKINLSIEGLPEHGSEHHSEPYALESDSRFSDSREPQEHGDDKHSEEYVKEGDARLSNNREPIVHSLAGARHSESTLEEVNSKITDATLINTTDARLSDDRTPLTHGDDKHSVTYQNKAERSQPDGYAPLNGHGKIPVDHLPDVAVQSTKIVADEAERLALTDLIEGSRAFQLDTGIMYLWDGEVWHSLANVDISVAWEDIQNKPTLLTLGETSSTAYRGDHGLVAYNHSQEAHAPSDANNYSHPSDGGGSRSGLSGATVISGITVNSAGHVTGTATRNMTATNVGAEPSFSKNNAFNKNFGTASGTVCQGNDYRLNEIIPSATIKDAEALNATGEQGINKYPHLRGYSKDLGEATFAVAVANGISDGSRLPTIDELEANVAGGTGLAYDNEICWSCSQSRPGYVWANTGKNGTSSSRVELSTDGSDTAKTRYVANVSSPYGSNWTPRKTVHSTSNPSGGADGDVWLKY